MATDFGGVTAAWTKTPAKAGDSATLAVSGSAITDVAFGPTTVDIVAPDGTQDVLTIPAGSTIKAQVGVKITAVTDAQGRKYTVAADGQSATTTA